MIAEIIKLQNFFYSEDTYEKTTDKVIYEFEIYIDRWLVL